jgi:hypothetical protein
MLTDIRLPRSVTVAYFVQVFDPCTMCTKHLLFRAPDL